MDVSRLSVPDWISEHMQARRPRNTVIHHPMQEITVGAGADRGGAAEAAGGASRAGTPRAASFLCFHQRRRRRTFVRAAEAERRVGSRTGGSPASTALAAVRLRVLNFVCRSNKCMS